MGGTSSSKEAIAIVGMGCRFPGAPNVASFWRMLRDGRDALADSTDQHIGRVLPGFNELPLDGIGALLPDIDRFDADFFGMSPHEASCLDPQQRLLLEVAWEAFEDAGFTRERASGARAGVFVGIWAGDFENALYANAIDLDVHLITGVGRFPGPNRISYALDLRGPSMSVDTACSSSLVAVHLAAQSIWSGQSEFALAGGVNVILRPEITEGFMRANMLSPDRRCKFGDATANGFVRSEGAGIVVLKPLSTAMRDGDRIYALIRGTAVNNDGQSNGMLLHPSREGQEQLLRDACRDAAVMPSEVQYVEAHGTGTGAGDPVEIEALGNVFGTAGRRRACLIGSVKTNIGHTEGAAGIAGVIKVALSLSKGVIPASLHFHEPNPKVPWSKLALAVPQHAEAWPTSGGPAIAGVSAFGLTGTNAHVVMEAVPEQFPRTRLTGSETAKTYLVPLSAKSPETLDRLAQSYVHELRAEDEFGADIGELAHTAGLRRTHHEQRLALVVRDRAEIGEKLDAFLRKEPAAGSTWGSKGTAGQGKIAFVFPGQGAQWTGMGRQLFRDEQVFREEIERCHTTMQHLVSWSLLDVFASTDQLPQRIDVIQPALFVMSAALTKLWASWGVTPDAVVGHSMGEIAAAYAAGALSLGDAAAVICRRSALMRRVEGQGSMALVEMPVDVLQQRIRQFKGHVSIAASNSASSTVLSGETAPLESLLAELEREQVFCRFVKVDVASHSAYVDPIRDALLVALEGIRPERGTIPIYSTVTGVVESGERLDHNYWVRNLRDPVTFGRAVQQLIHDGFGTFIELSPHPLLVPAVQAGFAEAGSDGMVLPSLKRDEDERASLLATAGAVYVAGYALNWSEINGSGRCVSLPPYAFQREHAWPEKFSTPSTNRRHGKGHPFLDARVESSVDQETWLWEMEIDVASKPYLADHRVRGQIVFPGAAYLEIVLAAARETGLTPGALESVEFVNALSLLEGSARRVQLALSPIVNGDRPFRLSTREEDGSWTVSARGRLMTLDSPLAVSEPLEAIRLRCPDGITGEEHYRRLAERGLRYGPAFQLVERAWFSERESLVSIRCGETSSSDFGRYLLPPPLLDACLQAVAQLFPQSDLSDGEETYVPISVERVRLAKTRTFEGNCFGYAVRKEATPGMLRADVILLDSAGDCVVEVQGLVCRSLDRAISGEECLYELYWKADRDSGTAVLKPGSGRWLLLADKMGTAARTAAALQALGHRCVLAYAAEAYRADAESYTLNPTTPADYQRLLTAVGPCEGVLHLWSLELESPDDEGAKTLDVSQAMGASSVVLLVCALAEAGWNESSRLWLATTGLHDPGQSNRVSVEHAPVWGLGRVIACEHPELCCASVDLSTEAGEDEIALLAHTLRSVSREDQIVIRGTRRYFARYRNISRPDTQPIRATAATTPYRAAIAEPGSLDSIGIEPMRFGKPGPGQVTIEVRAAGLNFIDVLKSLEMYPGIEPGTSPPLGAECAGTVISTGSGVTRFKPGDPVIAMTPSVLRMGMLASHVLVPEQMVVARPSGLSWEEAATTPLAFLTAWYALYTLARIRPGERVLIHAGSGGVGLAAIQLARRAGARVFATAGSPEKRAYLRDLGIESVFDSRSTAFAREILNAPGSAGVDVVLNSLSGEFLEASLSTLNRYGRFVEIGKRDIYANRAMGLGPFRKNLSFFAVDLAAMLEERRDEMSALLEQVLKELQDGVIQPLPVRAFPASQASDMFHHMASARHIGKLAMTFSEREVTLRPARPGKTDFQADAGYLITGGLGGIGLVVAQWMVDNGARYLVLAGRSKPSEQALANIGEMQARGAVVRTLSVDVSRFEDVKYLLASFGDGFPALRGVIHAAAVVNDELIARLNPAQLGPVMAPKAVGAWNLHQLTAGMNLDFFVLFSSIASVLPQPGHGSYAAANAFLDALARHRRALGLPGLSVNWGGWSGTGLALAAGASSSIRGYASRGIKPMPPSQALEALSCLLGYQTAGALAVPVDWRRVANSCGAEGVPPVLADLIQEGLQAGTPEARSEDPVSQIRLAPSEQRRELLETHLRGELSRVLRLAPSRIERDKRLGAMGLDSLMAVTFVRRLSSSLGIVLPATAAFNYPTVSALAAHVARKLGLDLGSEHERVEPAARSRQGETGMSLEDVSEEEAILALLTKGVAQ
jgi:phthiocerol/phenolphthiocerol synthesis type-I polyketide synthase C